MKKDKKNTFNLPEGYFDDFNDRLMDKINKEEIQPKSVIPKSDGFAVPKEYFGDVTESVLSKTVENTEKVIQLHAHKKLLYVAAAVAALFIMFIGINWKSETGLTFEDLANGEIDAYFDRTEIRLSSCELAELIPLENVELNDVLENDIESENILEYLDENVEDIEELNLDFLSYE